jgi:hypothetical protein
MNDGTFMLSAEVLHVDRDGNPQPTDGQRAFTARVGNVTIASITPLLPRELRDAIAGADGLEDDA